MNAVRRFFCSWLRFLRGLGARFMRDRCLRLAAALAFASLLALVPLVSVVFSMLSVFPVFEQWALSLEEFVYRYLVPAAGDVVRENVNQFVAQVRRLTAFGVAFLLLSALLLLSTIEDAFNDIWRVHRGRGIVQRLLVYWTVITLGPVLIGASLSLTTYLVSISALQEEPALSGLRAGVVWVMPILFEWAAFLVLYLTVPNCTVAFRDAAAGGVIAAVLFELTKRGFAVYLLTFSAYEVIYGALAAIPIFLIWIYLSWLVILIGAETVASLTDRRRGTDTPALAASLSDSGKHADDG